VVSLVKEGRELPRGHCLLRWEALPGATYDLEVRTLTGDLVFADGNLAVPFYWVPEWSLASVASGHRLEWKVTAHLHGEVSHFSSTFRLR
jgi:hypothetical protein